MSKKTAKKQNKNQGQKVNPVAKKEKRMEKKLEKQLGVDTGTEIKNMVEPVGSELGNGGEPVMTPAEMSYIEDTRKPEPGIDELEQEIAETGFNPQNVVDAILKKYGVKNAKAI